MTGADKASSVCKSIGAHVVLRLVYLAAIVEQAQVSRSWVLVSGKAYLIALYRLPTSHQVTQQKPAQ